MTTRTVATPEPVRYHGAGASLILRLAAVWNCSPQMASQHVYGATGYVGRLETAIEYLSAIGDVAMIDQLLARLDRARLRAPQPTLDEALSDHAQKDSEEDAAKDALRSALARGEDVDAALDTEARRLARETAAGLRALRRIKHEQDLRARAKA